MTVGVVFLWFLTAGGVTILGELMLTATPVNSFRVFSIQFNMSRNGRYCKTFTKGFPHQTKGKAVKNLNNDLKSAFPEDLQACENNKNTGGIFVEELFTVNPHSLRLSQFIGASVYRCVLMTQVIISINFK